MKKWIMLMLVMCLAMAFCGCEPGWGEPEQDTDICAPGENRDEIYEEAPAEKPVIYLYPEEETEVKVELQFDGELICTYPEYRDGWTVTAAPDGTLTDKEGREYGYLFWEGIPEKEFAITEGFVVPGNETLRFLEDSLRRLGLTDREAGDFITYWLPRMEGNPWNLISFQFEAYEEMARLNVTPEPDSMIRVFMTFRGLDAPVEIPEQSLPTVERTGFAVVEWGGMELG